MTLRRDRAAAGATSPQLLVFLALVALVLVGAGVAWLVLRGGSTPIGNVAEQADPEPPSRAADAPEPAVTAAPAPSIVQDQAWEDAMRSAGATRLPVRDRKTGKVDYVNTYSLTGNVLNDSDGQPVYYYWIYLIPVDQGDPAIAKNSWSPNHFRNGRFQLDHQPAGTYHMIVESREHEPVTRTIQIPYEGSPLEVRLRHGTCIRGVVRDALQTPLKDIEVHLGVDPSRIDGGVLPPMQRQYKTDELGRYFIWKLPPGEYSLKVAMLGDVLAEEPPFRVDPGSEILRDFTLERFGTLRLTVTNVAEQPVAKARVMLMQERDDGRDRQVRTAYSDLKGVARLDFVRQGSYKLKVQMQGFQIYEQPVSVAAGEGFREMPVRLEVAQKRER
jgi:hypothetical protein